MTNAALTPGLAVIHANRLENLRDLLVAWIAEHPLAALENETVLVQSNGMAQWLKLALAADDGLGICAAVDVQLPARFLWRSYQTVLGDRAVPEVSPYDKNDMVWRIYRHLPDFADDGRFAAIGEFLDRDDDRRKRFQLSQCLADLFDQYQVYRADWLEDWHRNDDCLRDSFGNPHPLAEDQRWQPALWRALVADLPESLRGLSRAGLHRRFLSSLDQAEQAPANLPRRIVVFGISSLPQQTLQALQALGRFCQILLCVHNPCRYYWADIIEHRQLLRTSWRRHADKLPADLDEDQLHLHANPLLAAWGKQGRDYIGLLAEIDDPQHYRDWFQRIDLFEDWTDEALAPTLLQRVQQTILDLTPLPAADERESIAADDSLQFHLAHSPQREVEILQDQLLAMLEHGGFQPREIIVMVPDIDLYAPHIRAVFGRIAADDPRYIPFGVSDQRQRGQKPLLIALEYLLQAPEARFSVSEVLDLLDVPALRQRFGIAAEQLPLLRQWIAQSGIRWGLHAEQRRGFAMPADDPQNSWQFGLRRLLLGYAVGNGEAWGDIEPCAEVSGLDAVLLGPLSQLLDALEQSWRELAQPLPASQWSECYRRLLQRFFLADSDEDDALLEQLHQHLDDWDDLCDRVGLREILPPAVAREVWLQAIDQPSLSQRFLAGRVNFCTLMPMRSIPFQMVCLLGMNDGDFPRGGIRYSFDLMNDARLYRPGDRSRRDDDRYLFLEALLSARRCLYVSWVGSSVKDNTAKPPSLLVGQLRDYLAGGWRLKSDEASDHSLLAALTSVHPLQPFSKRYFKGEDPRWFSYADEWRQAWRASAPLDEITPEALPLLQPETPLTLNDLAGFLRYPVKSFFNRRLQVWLEPQAMTHDDDEAFACDTLQAHRLGEALLQAALHASDDDAAEAFADAAARQRRAGLLPLAGFAEPSLNGYALPAWAAWEHGRTSLALWPQPVQRPPAVELEFTLDDGSCWSLEDWLSDLRRNDSGAWAQLIFSPRNLLDGKGKAKMHNLLRPWVKHLAACALGLPMTTRQIGADACIELSPLPVATASELLREVLEAWRFGMSQPLPLACRSGFAWLDGEADKAYQAAEQVYHGNGFNLNGEVDDDAYLGREFPDFAMLHSSASFGFSHWVERLYRPLFQHAIVKEVT